MKDLIKDYKSGKVEVFEDILRENKGVIYNVVSQFNIQGYDREDLYQEACITLVRSIELYDENKGIKFSNFLAFMIRNRLINITKEKSVAHYTKLLVHHKSEFEEATSIEDDIIYKDILTESLVDIYRDLTDRDKIIMDTIFNNCDWEAVANELGMSLKTFRNYRSKIIRKINDMYSEVQNG